uniref:HORMA domain-containing protein n=1 Tax=Panagrellus redivivus TaxID=6233 RepID=A0A7E4VSD2_PANRE
MNPDDNDSMGSDFPYEGDDVEKLFYTFTVFALANYVKSRRILPADAFREAHIEGRQFFLFDKEAHGDSEKFHYSLLALKQLFKDRTIAEFSLVTYDDKTKNVVDKFNFDFIFPSDSDSRTIESESHQSEDSKDTALRQLYKIASLGENLADCERDGTHSFVKKPFIVVNQKAMKTDPEKPEPVKTETPLCYVPATPERTVYRMPRDMQTYLVGTLDAGDGNQIVITYESAFFHREIEDILVTAYSVGNLIDLLAPYDAVPTDMDPPCEMYHF